MSHQTDFHGNCFQQDEIETYPENSDHPEYPGVLLHERPLGLTAFNSPSYSGSLWSNGFEDVDIRNTQGYSSFSTPTVHQDIWVTDDQLSDLFASHLQPQPSQNQTVANQIRDARLQHGMEESDFENDGLDLRSANALNPVLDRGHDLAQQDNLEGVGNSISPPNASVRVYGSPQETTLAQSDLGNGITFSTMTIESEEEKHRMLGTIIGPEILEFPDVFMNRENGVTDLDKPKVAEGKADAIVDEDSESIMSDQITTERNSREARKRTADKINGASQVLRRPRHLDFVDFDMLDSWCSTPGDIVKQLDYMPVSSLNAYLNGNDPMDMNARATTQLKTGNNPDRSDSKLTILPGTRQVKDSSILGNPFYPHQTQDNNLDKGCNDNGVIGEEEALSSQGMLSRTAANRWERGRNKSPRALHEAPIRQAPSFASLPSEWLEDTEKRGSGVEILVAGCTNTDKNSEYENHERSASASRGVDNNTNMSTNQVAFQNILNHQIDNQEPHVESGNVTIDLPRSASMIELWSKMDVFNKRTDRESQTVNGSTKYYSIKRMQKDASDLLDIAQHASADIVKRIGRSNRTERELNETRESIRQLRERVALRVLGCGDDQHFGEEGTKVIIE